MPRFSDTHIALKHGAGGQAMRGLVETLFVDREILRDNLVVGPEDMDDGAVFSFGERHLVLTTDSHVIQPIFFPGGDIGRLAVAGTVNDLAVMGGYEVLGLTCGIVLEDGFPRADLERIVHSMRTCAREADAPIVTGDTKVMPKGELDGIIINTAGIAIADRVIVDRGLKAGDRIIVSGAIGDHGFAVMAARNNLVLEGDLRSDVAPLGELVRLAVGVAGQNLHAMKDATRGGLASALHEMAGKADVGIIVDEPSLPVSREARAVSELLGIEPVHVANEGKIVLGVGPGSVEAVLDVLKGHPLGQGAAVIAKVTEDHRGQVILDTGLGRRILPELEGEPLPRIC